MTKYKTNITRFFIIREKTNRGPTDPVPKLITGCFGAIAGAASVFGNTPVDVVKTRMQVRFMLRQIIKR